MITICQVTRNCFGPYDIFGESLTVKVLFIAILSSALCFSNHILTRVQSLSCMLVKGVIPFSWVLNYVRKFADELYVFHCDNKQYLVVHIASMNTCCLENMPTL